MGQGHDQIISSPQGNRPQKARKCVWRGFKTRRWPPPRGLLPFPLVRVLFRHVTLARATRARAPRGPEASPSARRGPQEKRNPPPPPCWTGGTKKGPRVPRLVPPAVTVPRSGAGKGLVFRTGCSPGLLTWFQSCVACLQVAGSRFARSWHPWGRCTGWHPPELRKHFLNSREASRTTVAGT